ncbi:hypothetical protein ACE2AK_13615 [Rahnella perminowiae]|uniref:hypothetical protein n=1 Tax=Rahnella perminowiae TaxID=2816244 RepID=UPI003665C274
MKTLNRISALKDYKLRQDNNVFVNGYFQAGDGGGGHYYWDKNCVLSANNGTVIRSDHSDTGRWLLIHQGVGDFRTFGVLNADQPADDALDALVNDPAISQIFAFSDLLFQRRHRFSRSDITLDFQNNRIFTTGIASAPANDPFAAVLFFQGTVTGMPVTFTLTETLQEQTDIFPVADSSVFQVGDWYAVQVTAVKGAAERELQKLVEIIAIPDSTHIQIDYYNGWELLAGRIISWQKVEPVKFVTVKNIQFFGAGADQITGSHPVAFEFAVYANVEGIHSTGSFWPVVMRRWNTHYLTKQCSLINPPNTAFGGAGYLTQQIYCLYGQVSDCSVANARHLNDFTASAYCLVENCHASGQSAEKGPFVTHGQYEHDLTYTGNSGLMTFANSGATWGGSAKRINVRKHVCPWFVARTGVSELTLEDVVVMANDTIPQSGMLWVNADGLQMTGCTADRTQIISQASQRAARPNVIRQCQFSLPEDGAPVVQSNVTAALTFTDTVFNDINGQAFDSTAPLNFVRCTFNATTEFAPLTLKSSTLSVQASQFNQAGFVLSGTGAKQIDILSSTMVQATLDFTAFTSQPAGSLMFLNNRLSGSAVIAQPPAGERVIWQQNMIFV